MTAGHGRRLAALALVGCALLVACTGGGGGAAATTTTTPAPPLPTTTSTTAAPTAIAGFHTRQPGLLTVGTDRRRPPWFVGDAGGVTGGFEYDLARAIGSRLRVRAVVVDADLALLQAGFECSCDVYLGHLEASERLARGVDLSEPYLTVDQAVVVRAGTTTPTAGTAPALRWGVTLLDDAAAGYVQSTIRPTAPLQLFGDEAALRAALAGGTIDAALLDAPEAVATAATDATITVAGRIATGGVYVALLPFGSPNTSALNGIIRDLRAAGTTALLARRWFGVDPSTLPLLALG